MPCKACWFSWCLSAYPVPWSWYSSGGKTGARFKCYLMTTLKNLRTKFKWHLYASNESMLERYEIWIKDELCKSKMKRFVSTITKICKLRFCIHISSIRQASLSIFIKLSSDGAESGGWEMEIAGGRWSRKNQLVDGTVICVQYHSSTRRFCAGLAELISREDTFLFRLARGVKWPSKNKFSLIMSARNFIIKLCLCSISLLDRLHIIFLK